MSALANLICVGRAGEPAAVCSSRPAGFRGDHFADIGRVQLSGRATRSSCSTRSVVQHNAPRAGCSTATRSRSQCTCTKCNACSCGHCDTRGSRCTASRRCTIRARSTDATRTYRTAGAVPGAVAIAATRTDFNDTFCSSRQRHTHVCWRDTCVWP